MAYNPNNSNGQKTMANSSPVVIASDQSAIPVTQTVVDIAPATQNITVVDSGSTSTAASNGQTLVTGTPTAGSAASFTVSSLETVRVQVTGTWTGTIASEISIDGGTTWFAQGLHQGAYTTSTFFGNFVGGGSITGATNFRMRATAAITGTAVVKIIESINTNSVYIANAAPAGNVISLLNSSTATLTSGSVFTGAGEDVSNFSEMRVSVISNVASATDGLSIQQSPDNTNWDITDVYTIAAATAKTFVVPRQARYFRVVYTNGGTNQASFRLQSILNRTASSPSSQRAQDAYTNETDLEQNQAFLMGFNGTTWDRLRSTGTGILNVALAAGAALIGKVSIDQTTPGTTNGVQTLTGSTTAVTGNVTVVQPTGTNLHAVIDTGSTTAVTQATAANLNATVVGTGTFVVQNTQSGTASQNVAQIGGTNVVTAGVSGLIAVGGNVANAVTATANPVPVGGVFTTSPTTLTTGQTATAQFTAAQNIKSDFTTIAATAVDTNSGNKSAGTQRIVIATDQPNLTTPLNVALAANQSVNVAQINAVTPLMGNGVTGTGSQRVTIASDNTAFAVNATLSAETTKVIGTVNQGTSPWVTSNATTSVVGNGAAATAQRVTLANDSTGIIATVGAVTAITNALPTGTNSIGKISDITTSVVPGTAATNLGKAEDAAHTTGDVGVMALAVRADTAASTAGTTGDYQPPITNNIGALWVAGVASTNGGWSVASGTTGSTKVDIGTANTPGQVGGWYFYNSNASVAYVQVFNFQASAVTLGTTAPLYSLGIPASSGANIAPSMVGIAHSTAISIAITTTRSGSTGPGSTVDYNIFYKQ